MDKLAHCDQKTIINELTQGRELAKQLQIHLNVPYSSHEFRELLAQKILKSYEKVLSALKSNGSLVGISESLNWFSESPHSEDSNREYKDLENGDGSKKRKSLVPGWTQKVQVCPGTRIEGPLDDGYSWRKYGQKDILGAKYPRGYYRCIHRNLGGCLATKQVQRSDDDPTIFEITYRGSHTCTQNSLQTPPEKQETNTAQENHQTTHQPQHNSPEILLNFQTGLKVETKDLDNFQQPFSSIYFPSSMGMVECNNFMGSFSNSSSFVSPTQMNNTNELSEIVSATNSSTNSPTLGLDFPFGLMEFDPNFTFG